MSDKKISQLNSLTKSTIDVADVIPVVDTSASETKKITYQELIQPLDTQFAIVANSDTTKKVKFQVSGVTTATTRTLTIPDDDTTIVGTGTTQTLTNKTLTAPQINMGSDSIGDMYYRNTLGEFDRFPIGTSGQIIQVSSGGIPEYIDNPAASNASTTVKGVVEIATTAEITAGTGTGGTGALLVVPASAVGSAGASKLVQYDASGKLPAVDGSQLTNIVNPITYKNGTTTKDASDASTTQNIAHGLGKTPKKIKITALFGNTATTYADMLAFTVYNGTTQSSISRHTNGANVQTTNTFVLNGTSANTDTQTGVVTFDATNIIITWTKSGSPTGTYQLLWEAEA